MRTPKSKYAYIGPTYKQAKNIAWDILKEYGRKIDGVTFNESELKTKFANGSQITLYGSDNPDSLRGLGLWGVVYDEYSQQPSNIHTEIIRPALADHHGYAIWIGTPKGKNDFYRLYDHSTKDDKWLGILLTVDDTGIINDEELADSRTVMTEDEYNQEWYCSFTASIKGAYYAEELALARTQNRIRNVLHDNSIPVYTVWDLGVSDSMSIGFFQKVHNEVRLIDYYENANYGLDHYIKVLQDKGYVYGVHIAPHDVAQRELTTGKTRLEIAESLGISFHVLPRLNIADGIHAGRLMFSRLWVDEEKCMIWLDYIAQYHREWDDRKGMFRDFPYKDFTSHAADMYRYAALSENLMTNEVGGLLLDDSPTNARPGITVKDGYVAGEEMWPREDNYGDDWKYGG